MNRVASASATAWSLVFLLLRVIPIHGFFSKHRDFFRLLGATSNITTIHKIVAISFFLKSNAISSVVFGMISAAFFVS